MKRFEVIVSALSKTEKQFDTLAEVNGWLENCQGRVSMYRLRTMRSGMRFLTTMSMGGYENMAICDRGAAAVPLWERSPQTDSLRGEISMIHFQGTIMVGLILFGSNSPQLAAIRLK